MKAFLQIVATVMLVILLVGCGSRTQEFRNAIVSGDSRTVQELVSKDHQLLRARYEEGDTPLHLAAANGQRKVAEILIGSGADMNATNDQNATPLQTALAAYRAGHSVAKTLVEHGANIPNAPSIIDAENLALIRQQLEHQAKRGGPAAGSTRQTTIAEKSERGTATQRAEAERIRALLQVDVRIGWQGSDPHTATLRPGEMFNLTAEATNNGTAPIPEIRFVLEPNKYVDLQINSWDKPSTTKAERAKFRQWMSTGLPMYRYGASERTTVLNPANDPHWDGTGVRYMSSGEVNIRLSPKAPPGSDITMNTYASVKGKRLQLVPLLIHVQHPD